MTMVEKAAKALARHMLSDVGKAAFDNNPNYYKLSFSPSEHKRLEAEVRVVIEAMREIPESMYDNYRCEKVWKELSSTEVWNLWIDAALKE